MAAIALSPSPRSGLAIHRLADRVSGRRGVSMIASGDRGAAALRAVIDTPRRPEKTCLHAIDGHVSMTEKIVQVLSPPAATRDDKAVEMLRVWIAEGGLHCALRVGVYLDQGGVDIETSARGTIIADAIRHIGDALAVEGLGTHEDLVSAILGGLRAEIEEPTSPRKGDFVAEPH